MSQLEARVIEGAKDFPLDFNKKKVCLGESEGFLVLSSPKILVNLMS